MLKTEKRRRSEMCACVRKVHIHGSSIKDDLVSYPFPTCYDDIIQNTIYWGLPVTKERGIHMTIASFRTCVLQTGRPTRAP